MPVRRRRAGLVSEPEVPRGDDGGGGGGDAPASAAPGGSGYGTSGVGGHTAGTQDAGSVTIDGVTVLGGAGGQGTGAAPDARPYTNGGGGGMCGGGGGGGGDGLGGGGGSYNAGAGGQGYVRLEYDAYNDMTLISNAQTAQSAPTKAHLVFTYTNGAGTAVLGTNITAEVSMDNGSTYTNLSIGASDSQGTTGGHTIVTKNDVTLSSTSGTNMRYRIKTLVQSISMQTRIQAVSLGWS